MNPARHGAAFLAMLLAACTPMQWVKQDATAEQLAADSEHCQNEAWREASFRSWAFRPASPILLRDAAGRPFVAWQHSPFSDPFGDRFMEESRLANFCMRAKGYRLEAVEKPAETIQPSPDSASGGKP
jgi:hypothetical protein